MSNEAERCKNILKIHLDNLAEIESELRNLLMKVCLEREFLNSLSTEAKITQLTTGLYIYEEEEEKVIQFPPTKHKK